jgi:TRAP-type C4-dicarboxylate transport system permease small subunit
MKSLDHLSNLMAKIVVLTMLPAMIFLGSADVVMRYFFSNPIPGVHDISGLMMMIFVMFSLPSCWLERGHIRVELIVRRFPSWAGDLTWALAAEVGFICWGTLTAYSFVALSDAIKYHEVSSEAMIVLWPFRLLFSIASTIFSAQMLMDSFRYLVKAIRNKGTGE